MFIHGTKDAVVPFRQSELLAAALANVGVEAILIPVEGGGHGGFNSAEAPSRIKAYFDKRLLGRDVAISHEPIKPGATAPAPPSRPN
jgi:pimeloyl-ACP methyl ester carboxylesterase